MIRQIIINKLNLINIVTKTRHNKMRFSNTLIVIASLSAAAKADECLPAYGYYCFTDDDCCDELVCSVFDSYLACMPDETKQNENGADVGEPCDANADCDSGWCNIHEIPHACEAVDNGSAAVGEKCDVNGDCTSGWCNIHSIPHVCGAVDVNGAAVGEPCDTNGDCTSGWCNIHHIPHVCGATDEKDGGVVKQLLEVFQ